jgi:glycerol-3-phosphate acyltransferase PlsY
MPGILSFLTAVILVGVGYALGAIPMGYVTIKLFRKQDITQIGSGRTGGTNAMRAGGVWVGVLTGLLDLLKGFLAVRIAQLAMPDAIWVHVFAGVASVLGHNWSLWLFLLSGKLSAGAGTGPNVGAAMAFWPPTFLVTVPLVLFMVFIVGYASLASLSTGLVLVVIFALRAAFFDQPWELIVFSLITASAVAWALRPNIQRLFKGQERRVGVFARKGGADEKKGSA